MYIKPTSNYKMPKPFKMLLANKLDPHARGEFKRALIQADLASKVQVKDSKNKRSQDSSEE